MKRYLCILFLLFGCFIFRGDYAPASGTDRLVEAVYTGAGDFSTAYAYDANGETSVIDTAAPQPYPYSRHDTWIEGIMLHLGASDTCSDAKQPATWVIELHSSKPFAIDEIYALPR